jgi:hypothetical protein
MNQIRYVQDKAELVLRERFEDTHAEVPFIITYFPNISLKV